MKNDKVFCESQRAPLTRPVIQINPSLFFFINLFSFQCLNMTINENRFQTKDDESFFRLNIVSTYTEDSYARDGRNYEEVLFLRETQITNVINDKKKTHSTVFGGTLRINLLL